MTKVKKPAPQKETRRTKIYDGAAPAGGDSVQYLDDFKTMPAEKQRRHLTFIVRWLVDILRG